MRMNCTVWGFIGLGQMGYPMAKQLRANMPSSDRLIILDMNGKAMQRFVKETKMFAKESGKEIEQMRVDIARNAREVAESSSVVVTCLPTPEAVKSLFDSILIGGELPLLPTQRLFIDCSTIDPQSSNSIANSVQKSLSSWFVDAPVSGGVVAARAGTLSFMFGSPSQSQELIERIRSILSLMGKKIWHTGKQGTGVASKLANNYILAINNIATSEAMTMGIRWGLDPVVLNDLINSSTGRCWPTEVNNPVPGVIQDSPASRDYEPGGTVAIIHKDLRLAIAGAEESGIALALAREASKVYDAVDKTYSGKDLSVVYKWLQEVSKRQSK